MEKLTRKTCVTAYVCSCCTHRFADEKYFYDNDEREFEKFCARCCHESKFVNFAWVYFKHQRWLRKKGKLKKPQHMKNLACWHWHHKDLPF